MFSFTKRLENLNPCLRSVTHQLRSASTYADGSPSAPRRRSMSSPIKMKKTDEKSEWWAVDGEMHEIGDNVPLRERFVIPRDNISNKRRKQLREQFMRRTRLVLKESEHDSWCKKYMELYQELRENWERLYWDEGYSKKLAQDHANYESDEDDDDDQDFSPYRKRWPNSERMKDQGPLRSMQDGTWNQVGQIQGPLRSMQDGTWNQVGQIQGPSRNRQDYTWSQVGRIRDKFEYDREKRMQQKAFAPMQRVVPFEYNNSTFHNQPFNPQRYIPQTERTQ